MIEVISPEHTIALKEFALFREKIYRTEGIRLPASVTDTLSLLQHKTPFSEGRQFRIFVFHERGRLVARAVAVFDQRYNLHWNEQLGHIIMFEALRNTEEAVRLLIDAACEWLKHQGVGRVRAGFGPFEPGFVIDNYNKYSVKMGRHNPTYYHGYFKSSGFETEMGACEYRIHVSKELISIYQQYLHTIGQEGYTILPLCQIATRQRITDFAKVWNDSYATHWGLAPLSEAEFEILFNQPDNSRIRELSAIAYRGDLPVGVVIVEANRSINNNRKFFLRRKSFDTPEQINSFAVGVCPSDRGVGVGLALASHAYLRLISTGIKHLSYGLVLDNNWPSRRVAEKLGAYAYGNYLTYRKTL